MNSIKNIKICCICGKPFEGYGNNPSPIETSGVCCDICHAETVVPRRLLDAKKSVIIAEADKITSRPLQRAESNKLNALVGSLVEVDFYGYDGDLEVGILHKDTPATRYYNVNGDNATVCGYWLDRIDGDLHFKKTHVKNIWAAEQRAEQFNALCGKSVFVKFVDGSVAAGFLHKQTVTTDHGAQIAYYYVETTLRRIRFYQSDVKTIREH